MSQPERASSALITVAQDLVTLTLSGNLDAECLHQIKADLALRTDVRPEHSLLVDLRLACFDHLTPRAVRSVASLPLKFAPNARRAIVSPDDLGFGLARMFENLRADQTRAFRVFRDIDAALDWLANPSER